MPYRDSYFTITGIDHHGQDFIEFKMEVKLVEESDNDYDKEAIKFNISNLIAYGMLDVADIEIGFWISGDEYDNFYTGPLSIKTSSAEKYNYLENTYQNVMNSNVYEEAFASEVKYYSDDIVYKSSDGMIQVLSVAIIENEDGNVFTLFEIENSSPEKIQAWGKEIYINGELVQSYSA